MEVIEKVQRQKISELIPERVAKNKSQGNSEIRIPINSIKYIKMNFILNPGKNPMEIFETDSKNNPKIIPKNVSYNLKRNPTKLFKD